LLILHGCWTPTGDRSKNGYFFVWGERPSAGKKRGRPSTKIPVYPFLASEEEMLGIIGQITDKRLLRQGYLVPKKNTLIFPSRPGFPPASPYLSGVLSQSADANMGVAAEKYDLGPWTVRGLALPAHAAVSFLSRLSAAEHWKGKVWADDILFWSHAAKFALELLIRQRFIPSLFPANETGSGFAGQNKAGRRTGYEKNSYVAAWETVFSDPGDAARLNLLAGAMPAVCRALLPQDGGTEQHFVPLPGEVLVREFLNRAVDGLVRHWFKPSPERIHIPKQRIYDTQRATEKWLEALLSENPLLPDDVSGRITALARDSTVWLKNLAGTSNLSFRTCFRLEPPDPAKEDQTAAPKGIRKGLHKAKDNDWLLSYHLQAIDDPSLLIPAGVVWKESKASLNILGRKFENPQERLLADLGRVSSFFTPVRDSLDTPTPCQCSLTAGEAYTFLREVTPLLEESGLGSLVPAWWQRDSGGAKPGVKIRVRPAGGNTAASDGVGAGMLGLDALVEYDWELSLGGQTISRDEFVKLASLKTPLVRLRGQWVELSPDLVDKALKMLNRSRGSMSLGEVLRMSASLQGRNGREGLDDKSFPVTDIHGEGWVADILDRLDGKSKLEELSVPEGFHGSLRAYQSRGLSWLHFLSQLGIGACLADDMGLGKTIQLIALLLYRKERGMPAGPVLLLSPTSVAGNWQRELERFGPSLSVLLHHGNKRLAGEQFIQSTREVDVVISTYALAHRDHGHFMPVNWDGVVLDEAQNIKNAESKQAQGIRNLHARFKIGLTGTPMENRLSDLWSIMQFLNPYYLGNFADFRARFAIPVERYNDRERLSLLHKMVRPFILRRLKTDPAIIEDLPEKQEIKVYCNLTEEQATLYQAVVQDMLDRIEASQGIERRGLILATLAKLKQVCNHPAHFMRDGSEMEGRSGKLARLTEILEEIISAGDRALIFSQYSTMGELLKKYLQKSFGREVLFLHGGVPARRRDVMVARFQEEAGGPQLFILSLKAGGVGLNLTGANHVIHFDRWWNPAVENQATDRAFRIGQTKNVLVHKFICAGTLEERIDEMIEKKKDLAESVISAGESWLTELGTDQLRHLFALGPDAVEGD